MSTCHRSTARRWFTFLFTLALAAAIWRPDALALAQGPQGQDGSQGPEDRRPPEVPAEKPLPNDPKDWVRDDFRHARRDGDSRLMDAVVILGNEFKDVTKENKNEKAAKLLTNLLRYEEPKGDASGAAKTAPAGRAAPRPTTTPGRGGRSGTGGYIPLDSDTIKATVYALLINDSKTAHPDDQRGPPRHLRHRRRPRGHRAGAAVLAVLPSPEHDDVLIRVATNPESIRPTPRASVPGLGGAVPGAVGKSAVPGTARGAFRGQRRGAFLGRRLRRRRPEVRRPDQPVPPRRPVRTAAPRRWARAR